MIANLEGSWYFTEVTVTGSSLLAKGEKIAIGITNNNNFNVTVPLQAGSKLLNDIPCVLDDELRPTLSSIWVDGNNNKYGLRLVFDMVDVSLKIVEGALGSIIERWDPPGTTITQPGDMGVITGSKG